jgi:hypothetical protein
MEARDEPGKIRPLSPDEPEAAPGARGAPSLPDRRWIPIAVAAGALIVFGLIAGVLGSSPADTPQSAPDQTQTDTTVSGLGAPPPPPTTTTTLPPTLLERAPLLERAARIVYRGSDGTSTNQLTWRLTDEEPGPAASTGAAAVVAAFDASRQELFWITTGQRDTLWVGLPPIAEPAFVDVAGAAWHPTTPLAVAWLGRPPGETVYHLYRATVLPTAGLDTLIDLGPVPEGGRLIGWGDWGFTLEIPAPIGIRQWEVPDPTDPDGATVYQPLGFGLVLDPLGNPVSAFVGSPRASSADGHMVVQPAPEAFELAMASGLDPASLGIAGELTVVGRGPDNAPFVVVAPDLTPTGVTFTPSSPATTFRFTPSGDHVAAMGATEGRFAVVTQAIDGSQRRLTSVDEVDVALGHSRDGSLLILHDLSSGAIVLHDWNRGASFRLPFALGRVLAVDV